MWLNRTTAPLLYGVALLLVSLGAPALGVPARALSGLNLALTAVYSVWLLLALLPRLKRRVLHGERRPSNPVPADIDYPRADLGDVAVRSVARRPRVRVLRPARQEVKDA